MVKTILIVENEPLWQTALIQLLSNLKGIQVCGVAACYETGLQLYRLYHPNLVLLDWQIDSEKTGIDLGLTLLQEGHPLEKLVLVSASSPSAIPKHPFLSVGKLDIHQQLCTLVESII
jgi:DNA-binding NarL/FixJ family response regulator